MKISADALREARGLVTSTLAEELLQHPQQRVVVLRPKHFGDERAPPGRKNRVARRSEWMTNSFCWYASLDHTMPPATLGAPSCSTRSTSQPCSSFLMRERHSGVVRSAWRVVTPRRGLMGTRSTPRMMRGHGHVPETHLQPAARARRPGRAPRLVEERKVELLVELDQLEGRARAEALLLGEVVPDRDSRGRKRGEREHRRAG